ncbi:hypothetical protein [Paenibacillus sp. FSL H8-0537]|uniref:hypothetical protein n=1 Tax=Paenibacillus sp. FSL H8-0537 TaxID=2921399 RepID=UPI0031010448
MAGKQVVFKPDEVRNLQRRMIQIGADTDELRRRVSGKIASWDRPLPVLGSLEQIQRQLTSLTQEAEQMTEVISKALKGIERVQAEAAQEAKQLAKGLSGLERFDLLKRVGTTGGGSYTPVPVTFRPMVTNLIDRILPQASRDRWSSDPLVKELRRVAGLQGATAAEKLDAEMKLEAIFAERDLIAKAQTAYAVYKQFGNHLLMTEIHKQAEISREKLKALGVAESYFAPNVNMTSYFKQVPLLACDYDPSFALEGDLTTRVPLPDNARYLFMVMMAQTQGPMGELARVQLKEIHALQQTIRTAAGGLVTDVQQGQVKSGLLNVLTILQSMQALSKYDPPPKEVIVKEKPGMLEKFGQDSMRSLEIYWSVLKNQASVEWAAIKQTGNSIAEVGTDLYNAHVDRANKSNDSVYDFFNNATMGLISVPGALWKEHEDRTANRNESVSAYLDYLSLGLTGMVQGAFAPENPNSKEHVQDVIGVLGLLFSVKIKAPGGMEPTVPKSPAVKPEDAGSGRGLGFGNQLVTPEGIHFMDSFPNDKSPIQVPKTDVQKRYLEEMDRLKREAEETGKGDLDIIRKDAPDYYQVLMDKYGDKGTYHARTPDDYEDLARDPDHNFNIDDKTRIERQAGIELEVRGELTGPIIRDPVKGRGEFIDRNGQVWDVKGFNSNYPPKKGGFRLDRAMADIEDELRKGENVILDTTKLSQDHIEQLRNAISMMEWKGKIRWWP